MVLPPPPPPPSPTRRCTTTIHGTTCTSWTVTTCYALFQGVRACMVIAVIFIGFASISAIMTPFLEVCPERNMRSSGAQGCYRAGPPSPPPGGTWSTAPSPGRPTPGVVKQSCGGSVDTTNTRSGPQRVRMSSGERPIGAAKGTQSDTEALTAWTCWACRVFTSGGGGGINRAPQNWGGGGGGGVREKGLIDRHH